jgi:restriction endonuclease S subunit
MDIARPFAPSRAAPSLIRVHLRPFAFICVESCLLWRQPLWPPREFWKSPQHARVCQVSSSEGFLYHLLGSRLFERYVLGTQTGLGVPHISGTQIQAFRFKMPNAPEQIRIVQELNAIPGYCESLIANQQRKLALLVALKQSLLQKAFAGELTTHLETALQEAAE